MLKKLTDRVYYMEHKESGDRPTLGLVIGDKYSLIIDGGNSKSHAESFLKEAKKIATSEIKYLVITHWHWDHIVGANYMNLINIVNGVTNEKLDSLRDLKWTNSALEERVKNGQEIEFCLEHIKIEHPNDDREILIPTGDIIYDEFLKIDLGGVKVFVEHISSDHSNDNSIVLIEESNKTTAFVGDSLYLDMYNGAWSYSKDKFIPLLIELECYEADYYVPSHHGLYTKESFYEYVNHMKLLSNIVSDKLAIEDCIKEFKKVFNKEPNEDDVYDMNCFIEGNKKELTII